MNGNGKEKRRKKPKGFLAVVAAVALAAAVATVPQAALADGHEDGGWSSDEIEFQPPEPVEGRRIFVERLLTVTGDRAAVTLRAATALDIRECGPSAGRRARGCASGGRRPWTRGSA